MKRASVEADEDAQEEARINLEYAQERRSTVANVRKSCMLKLKMLHKLHSGLPKAEAEREAVEEVEQALGDENDSQEESASSGSKSGQDAKSSASGSCSSGIKGSQQNNAGQEQEEGVQEEQTLQMDSEPASPHGDSQRVTSGDDGGGSTEMI
jgi:hypothetical protein